MQWVREFTTMTVAAKYVEILIVLFLGGPGVKIFNICKNQLSVSWTWMPSRMSLGAHIHTHTYIHLYMYLEYIYIYTYLRRYSFRYVDV